MEHTKTIPDCPVEMTLQLIGDKWKVLIIRDLMTGTKRFNELMLRKRDYPESPDQPSQGHGKRWPGYPDRLP